MTESENNTHTHLVALSSWDRIRVEETNVHICVML